MWVTFKQLFYQSVSLIFFCSREMKYSLRKLWIIVFKHIATIKIESILRFPWWKKKFVLSKNIMQTNKNIDLYLFWLTNATKFNDKINSEMQIDQCKMITVWISVIIQWKCEWKNKRIFMCAYNYTKLLTRSLIFKAKPNSELDKNKNQISKNIRTMNTCLN